MTEKKDTPPRWDLKDLFPGRDSAELADALADVAEASEKFSGRYRGKIAKLSGDALGAAIAEFEKISALSNRIATFAHLTRSADVTQAPWAQGVQETLDASARKMLFFTLEISKIPESDLLDLIKAPKLAAYAPFIREQRAFKDHRLSEEEEKYLLDRNSSTEGAWIRLYDLLVTDMRFDHKGQKLSRAEILHVMDSAQDAAERKSAFVEFTRVLNGRKDSFALITNTLADLKRLDDERRKFGKSDTAMHLANQIEPEVVEAMTKAVQGSYETLSHRYYSWKAKKLGVAALHPADRNAPLPGTAEKNIPWSEAKDIVLDSFAAFSPDFADKAERLFDENKIDADPVPGKQGGAFCAPSDPAPFVLMNYFGSSRNVKTLAHELGHAVHDLYTKKQGFLMAGAPLTLAETASIFAEMLTFRALLDAQTTLEARRSLIAEKVETMLNTVVRQTSFFVFEQKLHAEHAARGEVPVEKINEIWQASQKEALGPGIATDTPGNEILWAQIPHFIHSPFYVYSYAFGECLVNALYDAYEKTDDKPAFVEKYTALLEAGGTKRHREALEPFGFDLADPKFWKKGLSVIESYIDELIELDKKIELKNGFNAASANDDKPPAIPDPKIAKARVPKVRR